MSEQPSPVIQLPRDLISRFMQMTEADDIPHLYKKWSAISLVAGALERRVWSVVGQAAGEERRTFPNIYVFLVGAPGVGKSIVNSVRNLWRSVCEPQTTKPALYVADDNMTKASLIDSLAEGVRSFLPPTGAPYEYRSMLIASEEFGVFFTSYDLSFVATLNSIYGAPRDHKERRRHGPAKEVSIENPLLNILAGVQPTWMNSVFPAEAWGMGLCSRVIMVYAAEGEPVDPFLVGRPREIERLQLMSSLGRLSQLYGEVKWTPEAANKVTRWHLDKGPPRPTHSKLVGYCNRRTQHLIKLAMISAISRTIQVGPVESIDVERGLGWLLEAERLMPDIFRSMVGQSDIEIVEELHNYAMLQYGMTKQGIHERFLVRFLIQRVPSDKITKIIEMAERANMLSRIGGTDTYVPKERREFLE